MKSTLVVAHLQLPVLDVDPCDLAQPKNGTWPQEGPAGDLGVAQVDLGGDGHPALGQQWVVLSQWNASPVQVLTSQKEQRCVDGQRLRLASGPLYRRVRSARTQSGSLAGHRRRSNRELVMARMGLDRSGVPSRLLRARTGWAACARGQGLPVGRNRPGRIRALAARIARTEHPWDKASSSRRRSAGARPATSRTRSGSSWSRPSPGGA